jgi:hypothetical protein
VSGRRTRSSRQEPSLADQLAERFARWDDLYKNGGSDPFYTDGYNLNFVRNQIYFLKERMEKECSAEGLPDIFMRDTPPIVDESYMARADEIRIQAKKSLETYKADENYRYILSHVPMLDTKEKKHLCALNVMGYVSHLEECIKTDDLVYQRIHRKAENYLDSFKSCANQMRELLSVKEQLPSFFSVGAPQADDPDADEYDQISM